MPQKALQLLAAGACLVLPFSAQADRLMGIPTGSKILYKRLRSEFALDTNHDHNYRAYFGYGITREIDGELVIDRFNQRPTILTGDLAYLYVTPFIDASPGVALGVRDIADRTEDGRQFYVAVTYRMGAESTYNNDVPLELTLGAGTGRRNPIFVGVSLPFTWQFKVMAEHDGNRPRVGFEFLPLRNVSTRLQIDDRRTVVSLRLTHRF